MKGAIAVILWQKELCWTTKAQKPNHFINSNTLISTYHVVATVLSTLTC